LPFVICLQKVTFTFLSALWRRRCPEKLENTVRVYHYQYTVYRITGTYRYQPEIVISVLVHDYVFAAT